jgi:hypothetical protein
MLFMVASLAGQGAHVWRYSVITFTGIAHHDCGSVSRLNPSLVAPDLLPDLIIPTGKRQGQHLSVASIYRTLAEHDKAQAYPEALEQAHAEFGSRTRAQPGCMRAGRRRCLVRRFYTARRLTHAFLRWSIRNKLVTSVTLPNHDTRNPAPISQQQRLDTLRQLLTDDDIPLLTGVSAILLLLYAQPLTRILRLTVDDILHEDDEVSIRLGDPPIPVPEPFAGLLLDYVGHRLNLTTATNIDARWLFPGRRAGQPMTPDTIERRLRRHGIPALGGRTAALRHLVLQTPAPVVARMLGYTQQQTARLAIEAGSTWSRYAPGDHTRLQDQRTRGR